jgi:dTDP-4-amino-4,6-dideoxygalactose transaminase
MERVPLLDLSIQHAEVRAEIEEALRRIVDRNAFILGENVRAFEQEAARYIGVRHAIGVASGTDALLLALRALGVGPGDEVVLPAFTFVSTAEVVVHLGATPVYADVDPETLCIGEVRVTPRTKAILPVHLFGHPADMDRLAGLGVPLVEDGAQSFGAAYRGRKTLSLGRVNCTSFFPSKNLGAWGDGGMIFTDDDAIARSIRVLRNHGWEEKKYFPEVVAYNSRLDEVQAAVLRAKLRRLDAWTADRVAAAERYGKLLAGSVKTPPSGGGHVYHMYCIRTPRRDAVAAALKAEGVDTAVYYPVTIPGTDAFRAPGAFPHAEAACRDILAIPLYPGLRPETQERIAAVIRKVAESRT